MLHFRRERCPYRWPLRSAQWDFPLTSTCIWWRNVWNDGINTFPPRNRQTPGDDGNRRAKRCDKRDDTPNPISQRTSLWLIFCNNNNSNSFRWTFSVWQLWLGRELPAGKVFATVQQTCGTIQRMPCIIDGWTFFRCFMGSAQEYPLFSGCHLCASTWYTMRLQTNGQSIQLHAKLSVEYSISMQFESICVWMGVVCTSNVRISKRHHPGHRASSIAIQCSMDLL